VTTPVRVKQAIKQDNLELAMELSAAMNSKDFAELVTFNDEPLLQYFCRNNDIEGVVAMRDHLPFFSDLANNVACGYTPLQSFILSNFGADLTIPQILAEQGADLHVVNENGDSALHLSAGLN
jgi:hypothetical protein